MARITYVQKAQQRYATVPVIDPATGEQKRTPVMRNGVQRTTKRGAPVFLRITKADKSQPLPNRNCGKCGKEITVGSPYKHISPKSGPYGGRTLYRCAECPNWHVWEYSSSLGARTAQIEHDASNEASEAGDTDGLRSAAESAAEAIRELAEEKREGAQNIVDGFGHETSQSDELNDVADQLDSWADDVENIDFEEFDDGDARETKGEEVLAEYLSELADNGHTADGVVTLEDAVSKIPEFDAEVFQSRVDEAVSDAEDEWVDEQREKLTDALGECPV
jgi:hypothetical protein